MKRSVAWFPSSERRRKQRAIAWLPSNEHGALPSSPLLIEEPEERGEVTLTSWETPSLALTSVQAVAVLVASVDRTTWGPGAIAGKTLDYWATVLRFAGSLVARQQYLPGVVVEGDGTTFLARWEPVFTERRTGLEASSKLARTSASSRPGPWHALTPGSPQAGESAPPGRAQLAGTGEPSGRTLNQRTQPSVQEPEAVPRAGTGLLRFCPASRAEDGHVAAANGDAAELSRLVEQVQEWRRPIELAATAPFRLCLRLEEPRPGARGDNDRWHINYLLQAIDDLSLLVPVKNAWQPRRREATVLDAWLPAARIPALGPRVGRHAVPADRGELEVGRARGLLARRGRRT